MREEAPIVVWIAGVHEAGREGRGLCEVCVCVCLCLTCGLGCGGGMEGGEVVLVGRVEGGERGGG